MLENREITRETVEQGGQIDTIIRLLFCEWIEQKTYGGDRYYETACDSAQNFLEGTPTDNLYNYCPYCGKIIKVRNLKSV